MTAIDTTPRVRRIRARKYQQVQWGALSVVLGTGFVAGWYWLVLQQHYPFMPGSGSLKLWFDNGMGFIHSGKWPEERHGIRNLGEPAAWTIFAALLLLPAKKKPNILPTWLLVLYGSLVAVVTLAATVAITYGLDHAAAIKVDKFQWEQLAAGVALGFILKRAWEPVTGTIRYHVISKTYGVPIWVRLPLLSPSWRQEWIDAHPNDKTDAKVNWWAVVFTTLGVLVFLFVAVVGVLAKWAIARGVHVPGMTSG